MHFNNMYDSQQGLILLCDSASECAILLSELRVLPGVGVLLLLLTGIFKVPSALGWWVEGIPLLPSFPPSQ